MSFILFGGGRRDEPHLAVHHVDVAHHPFDVLLQKDTCPLKKEQLPQLPPKIMQPLKIPNRRP